MRALQIYILLAFTYLFVVLTHTHRCFQCNDKLPEPHVRTVRGCTPTPQRCSLAYMFLRGTSVPELDIYATSTALTVPIQFAK